MPGFSPHSAKGVGSIELGGGHLGSLLAVGEEWGILGGAQLSQRGQGPCLIFALCPQEVPSGPSMAGDLEQLREKLQLSPAALHRQVLLSLYSGKYVSTQISPTLRGCGWGVGEKLCTGGGN